jgi:hypothetical protein
MSQDLETAQQALALEILELSKATVKRMRKLMESDEPIPGSTMQAAVKLLAEASALANVAEVRERELTKARHDALDLPFKPDLSV